MIDTISTILGAIGGGLVVGLAILPFARRQDRLVDKLADDLKAAKDNLAFAVVINEAWARNWDDLNEELADLKARAMFRGPDGRLIAKPKTVGEG